MQGIGGGPVVESLDRILREFVRKKGYRKSLVRYRALSVWYDVVGEELGKHTKPLRIKDGILKVGVTSPGWSQQLSFLKRQILERLNKALGEKVVEELRFTTIDEVSLRQTHRESDERTKAIFLPAPEPTEEGVLQRIEDESEDLAMEWRRKLEQLGWEEDLKKAFLEFLKTQKETELKKKLSEGKKCRSCGAYHNEDDDFCPICALRDSQKLRTRCFDLLSDLPWLRHSQVIELMGHVPETLYEQAKKELRRHWRQKIQRLTKSLSEEINVDGEGPGKAAFSKRRMKGDLRRLKNAVDGLTMLVRQVDPSGMEAVPLPEGLPHKTHLLLAKAEDVL